MLVYIAQLITETKIISYESIESYRFCLQVVVLALDLIGELMDVIKRKYYIIRMRISTTFYVYYCMIF